MLENLETNAIKSNVIPSPHNVSSEGREKRTNCDVTGVTEWQHYVFTIHKLFTWETMCILAVLILYKLFSPKITAEMR